MAQLTKTGSLTAAAGRTTQGRDTLALPQIPSMTVLTISITGGTATVVVEYSEDETTFIPVATITATSGVQFAIPASVLATNVTAIAGATVAVKYRTIVLDNIPAQTLLIYGATEVSNPVVNSAQTVVDASTTRKKLAQTQIAAAATTVYTVPAATQAVVHHIFLVNPTGVDRIVSLWHDGSTDAFMILPPTTIVAGGHAVFSGEISMEAADTLVADSDAATAVTITVYGIEQDVPA